MTLTIYPFAMICGLLTMQVFDIPDWRFWVGVAMFGFGTGIGSK